MALTSRFLSTHAIAKAIDVVPRSLACVAIACAIFRDFWSPFGLVDPLVAATGARIGRRRCVHGVLAGQHAAR